MSVGWCVGAGTFPVSGRLSAASLAPEEFYGQMPIKCIIGNTFCVFI